MNNLFTLYKMLFEWRWKFFFSSLLLIFGMFFRAMEPLVLQVLVDTLIPLLKFGNQANIETGFFTSFFINTLPDIDNKYPSYVYILAIAFLYFSISASKGSLVFIAKTINASATEHSIKKLRDRIFVHIQKLPMSFFSSSKTGELTQRATGDIDTIRNFVSTQLVEIIRLSTVFIFSFFMIYTENKTFAFVSISLVPITIIASYIFFKKEMKIWQLHEDESDKLNNLTQENLSGIRVIQAFANEKFEIEKFEKQNKAKLKIALKHAKMHNFYWPFSDMIVNLQIFLSVLVSAWLTLNQTLTLGQFMSFYSYIIMVAFPLRQVSKLLSQMGMALVAISRIEEVFNAKTENLEGKKLENKLLGKIEFKNVSFKYSEEEDYVLKNINFIINPSEAIALIGPTGSGKSTLIKLLLRFYEPSEGKIFIDDIDLSTIAKKSIREKIGIVLQKAFLFSDTIKNNVAYTNNRVNIRETMTMAGLSNVDSIFVNGIDTMVGEKGVSLSGGQKQRVSLARTLLSNPDILVLDDVTSAVDTTTEKEILENLQEIAEGKTTINITHRLSSLPYANRIMIFENGKITNFAKKEELKNSKYFQKIISIQTELL